MHYRQAMALTKFGTKSVQNRRAPVGMEKNSKLNRGDLKELLVPL